MNTILLILCGLFIIISGRNDGAPLIALPLQTWTRTPWPPLLALGIAIFTIPLLGGWKVAASLQSMMGFTAIETTKSSLTLLAVLLTLLISSIVNIPTSITLALVGALAGATLATGNQIDQTLLIRVLLLGVLAPFVSTALSFTLSMVPLRAPKKYSGRQMLAFYRTLAFIALVVSYGINDGQKILFTLALTSKQTVQETASMPLIVIAGATLFLVGALLGLPKSAKFIRHGITTIKPVDLLWIETSTAATVIGGALVGVPLSMTQSITGSILGTGIIRSTQAVYWTSIRKIAVAWLWTLPFAGAFAFILVRLFSAH